MALGRAGSVAPPSTQKRERSRSSVLVSQREGARNEEQIKPQENPKSAFGRSVLDPPPASSYQKSREQLLATKTPSDDKLPPGTEWQVPYVDIFKHFELDKWERSSRKGNVTEVMDNVIGKHAYRILGKVCSANYLIMPSDHNFNLNLTGRYLYLEVRVLQPKYFVFHVDIITTGKLVCRLSFSNIFKETKSSEYIVNFPCADYTKKWTLIVIDLPKIVERYFNAAHYCVRRVHFCANMYVRGAYTSGNMYSTHTLPRDMAFVVPKGKEWNDVYDLVKYPRDGPKDVPSDPPRQLLEEYKSGQTTPDESKSFTSGKSRESVIKSLVTGDPTYLRPDPIMNLEMLFGYSGHRPCNILWLHDSPEIVHTSNSCMIIMNTANGAQRHLFGHTDDIVSISRSADGKMLASGQGGRMPIIRLWDTASGESRAILKAHESDLRSVDLSKDGNFLCAVGLDQHNRQLIVIWDISQVRSGSRAIIKIKYISEHHIGKLKFCPFDSSKLVSCGKDNIRFYRVKSGQLRASPLLLAQFQKNYFTDIAFEQGTGAREVGRKLYVSTNQGTVFQADHDTRTLESIYRLHDSAINSINVNEGFCVTASADRFVRVWPLDFSAFFLEAEHEGGLSAVDVSTDCLRLAVGSSTGSIGVLDIPSHSYQTVLRSHTDVVTAMSIDNRRGEFATASLDLSIRIWDVDTFDQLYEFNAGKDVCRTIAYHPTDHVICCGFDSGLVRIFDIPSTSLTEEFKQHAGSVASVQYSHDSRLLFSVGLDGFICAYDAINEYLPVRLINFGNCGGTFCDRVSFDIHPTENLIASMGPQGRSIILYEMSTLKETKTIRMPGDNKVTHIRFVPDKQELVYTTETMELRRLDCVTGRQLDEMDKIHRQEVNDMVVSPNGLYTVTCSNDRNLRIFPTGHLRSREMQTFIGHPGPVTRVGFTGDNLRLLSVGSGGATFVWKIYNDDDPDDDFGLGLGADSSMMQPSQREEVNKKSFAEQMKEQMQELMKGAVVMSPNTMKDRLEALDKQNQQQNAPSPRSESGQSSEPMVSGSESSTHLPLRHGLPPNFNPGGDDVSNASGSESANLPYLTQPHANTLTISSHTPSPHLGTERSASVSLNVETDKTAGSHRSWNPRGRSQSSPNTRLVSFEDSTTDSSEEERRMKAKKPLRSPRSKDDKNKPPKPPTAPPAVVTTPSPTSPSPTNPLAEKVLAAASTSARTPSPDITFTNASSAPSPPTLQRDNSRSSLEPDLSDSQQQHLQPTKFRSASPPPVVVIGDNSPVHSSGDESQSQSVAGAQAQAQAHAHGQAQRQLPGSPRPPSSGGSGTEGSNQGEGEWQFPVPGKAFVPREGQAQTAHATTSGGRPGVALEMVIGYNGRAHDNVAWHPQTGLFAYTCGRTLITEHLRTRSQYRLSGHSRDISTLALSLDGNLLATAAGSVESQGIASVRIWDTSLAGSKPVCRHVLKYHSSGVQTIAFQPKGRLLVTVGNGEERSVVVWDIVTGQMLQTSVTGSPVHEVKWDSFNKEEFVTVGSGAVTYWMIDNGLRYLDLELSAQLSDEVYTAVDFISANLLVVGTMSGKIAVLDSRDNSVRAQWTVGAEIGTLCFRSQSLTVGTRANTPTTTSVPGASSQQLQVWDLGFSYRAGEDVPAGSELQMYANLSERLEVDGGVSACILDTTGQEGLVGTTTGTVWYINRAEGAVVRLVCSHMQPVETIAFDSQGTLMATSSRDRTLRIWSVQTFQQLVQFDVDNVICTSVGFTPTVTTSDVGGSKRTHQLVVAGYDDGTVRTFTLADVKMEKRLHPFACCVNALIIVDQGRRVVLGADDGTVVVHSLETGDEEARLNSYGWSSVVAMASSLVRPSLWVIATADGHCVVWRSVWSEGKHVEWGKFNFAAPSDQQSLSNSQSNRIRFCLSPVSDRVLIVASHVTGSPSVSWFDMEARECVRRVALCESPFLSIDISHDGSTVAVAHEDSRVMLITPNGEEYLCGHSDSVSELTFSPVDSKLISAGFDDIFVWKVPL